MTRKAWLCALAVLACGPALGDGPKLLVIGDSLSAAHGIPREQGWVQLLQQRLQSTGYPHQVINRSKHGLTTTRALRDVKWHVETTKPEVVLIELGGVDGFLGMPLGALRENLTELVEKAGGRGARVALFEMWLPPATRNREYAQQFRLLYADVARAERVGIVPFFLASFAMQPASFQRDGIHPRAEVQAHMLDAVWPSVQELLTPPPQQLSVSGLPQSAVAGPN